MKISMYKVLIVDDESSVRYSFKRLYEDDSSYVILEAKDGEEALEIVQKEDIDVVVMDIRMPRLNGLEALKQIKAIQPKLFVILGTAYGTTEIAIEAMKYGAYDYLLKPYDVSTLMLLVEKALNLSKMMKTQVVINALEEEDFTKDRMIGSSSKMQEIYKLIGQIANSNATVLIQGESGTGKELVARAIFQHSDRSDKPFIAVNCAAIPENLLESELFGYEKGAFTGANQRRIGKFEQCNDGTIFLDEIGDMSFATQSKILRMLQEGTIERLGGNETIHVDVRVIAATNRNLEEAIEKKEFRPDLFYRLKVVTINLPPLRERKEDIPNLVNYFVKKNAVQLKKESYIIPDETMKLLNEYLWPGNIRELENLIANVCLTTKTNILTPELFVNKLNKDKIQFPIAEELFTLSYSELKNNSGNIFEDAISQLEKYLIVNALKEVGGNQVQAAKLLGISRSLLRDRMQKYNIPSE
jgi:two-component system nitrogen regulation response regulator GlnG